MMRSVLRGWAIVLEIFSRPLAKRLEKEAASHPMFRRLIIPIGEANYRLKARMQRRLDGHSTHGEIPPPSGGQAFQEAAEVINELSVLTAAGTALFWASSMSVRELRQEIKALKQRSEELSRERERLKHQLEQVRLA